MSRGPSGGHHEVMSSATFTPASGPRTAPPVGATSLTGSHAGHRVGDVLRALRVFAGAAVDVVLLGGYGEEAGVVRRK